MFPKSQPFNNLILLYPNSTIHWQTVSDNMVPTVLQISQTSHAKPIAPLQALFNNLVKKVLLNTNTHKHHSCLLSQTLQFIRK